MTASPASPVKEPKTMCEQGDTVVVLGFDVDRCIAPLVEALNAGDAATVASCCGHGHRPGVISLADGRELVICRDYEEARAVGRAFRDIQGTERWFGCDYGERLRSIRETTGVSQSELSTRTGLSPAAISQIENGHRKPNYGSTVAICRALRVSPNELFGWAAEP